MVIEYRINKIRWLRLMMFVNIQLVEVVNIEIICLAIILLDNEAFDLECEIFSTGPNVETIMMVFYIINHAIW